MEDKKLENLNKESLISVVAEKTGMTKIQTRKAVEEVFEAITDCLEKGGRFQYIGFGTFHVKTRAERMGYNPSKKQNEMIPAKRIPASAPGKNLREKVNPVVEVAPEEK